MNCASARCSRARSPRRNEKRAPDSFAAAGVLVYNSYAQFAAEISPYPVRESLPDLATGKVVTKTRRFERDEGPRADTTLEALAKLRPSFGPDGTVTARTGLFTPARAVGRPVLRHEAGTTTASSAASSKRSTDTNQQVGPVDMAQRIWTSGNRRTTMAKAKKKKSKKPATKPDEAGSSAAP